MSGPGTLAQFVGGESSKLAIIATTVAAAAALVTTLSILLNRRQASVERRLAGYELAPEPAAAGPGGPETSVVQAGVDLAERLARTSGLLGRVERLLEQADLPVRAAEVVFYVPVFAVLVFLLFSLVGGLLAGLIGGTVTLLAPVAFLERRRARRLRRFQAMLPATLTLLASSMRAGFSLPQALETAAREGTEPLRREFQRVFTEVRLGRPIEDALEDVANRMGSNDLAWTVMAIRIQREVGGNLAALLDTVADTMTKREALRREVRALTAEGRLSAVVLSVFPPFLGLLLYTMKPDYIEPLFEETLGIASIVAAAVLSVVGWLWLRRIVDIED